MPSIPPFLLPGRPRCRPMPSAPGHRASFQSGGQTIRHRWSTCEIQIRCDRICRPGAWPAASPPPSAGPAPPRFSSSSAAERADYEVWEIWGRCQSLHSEGRRGMKGHRSPSSEGSLCRKRPAPGLQPLVLLLQVLQPRTCFASASNGPGCGLPSR